MSYFTKDMSLEDIKDACFNRYFELSKAQPYLNKNGEAMMCILSHIEDTITFCESKEDLRILLLQDIHTSAWSNPIYANKIRSFVKNFL